MKQGAEKGFTLIELLIVLSVIAILVSIAVPRFRGMQDEGNIAKAKGELRTLQNAVESYYIHHAQTYPADAAAFATLINETPNLVGAVMPKDPFNGTNGYGYVLGGPANNKTYAIFSVGPGLNGAVTVSGTGAVTEPTNPASAIYVSNAQADTTGP